MIPPKEFYFSISQKEHQTCMACVSEVLVSDNNRVLHTNTKDLRIEEDLTESKCRVAW